MMTTKSKGQTSVEYSLMMGIIVLIAGALNLLMDDDSESAIEGRSTIGLMYESIETTVTRSYP